MNIYALTNILYHQLQKKKTLFLITCRPLHCLTFTKVCFDTSICSFTQILHATSAYIQIVITAFLEYLVYCHFSVSRRLIVLKVCLPGCVLVRYLVLQYSGALPEANVSDLPGSPAPVHPHPGWCPAHPAHTAATLHRHAGEHPYQAGGMQFHGIFLFILTIKKQ